jgi:hypothetical protein
VSVVDTGAGVCVEPGASAFGSVPTPVSVEVGVEVDVVGDATACGVPSWSVVTGAAAIAVAIAETAGVDANGPLVAGTAADDVDAFGVGVGLGVVNV